MLLKSYLPILDWLPNYNKSYLKGDLTAGLTVGVMLVPQGMAYAMVAGLPAVYGLYACIVPIILYSIFGTSRQLAVGPVAMVSLLTATSVGSIAGSGTTEYIQFAILLAFFVGIIQLLMGIFKLGFLVNFLSHPVISGFTSAAALIIGLSQLKHLLGVEIARSYHINEILHQAYLQVSNTNWITFVIGTIGILMIIGLQKLSKAIPAALIIVVLGILSVWMLGLEQQGVKIVGEIPKELPKFSLLNMDLDMVKLLLPMALAIALVSFMESIAIAKSIQSKHQREYKVVPNQELIALGLTNIGGSLFQSYPTAGGFARTAVNNQAGANTGLAGLLSASLIVLTLLFLTPMIYYLPKAILASIIMVAVYGLIDFKEVKYLWHSNKQDFAMLIITFIATLSLGIEQGIGVGVILSLVMVLFRTTRPHTAILAKVPKTHLYRNIDRFDDLDERKDILIYRFDAQLFFANINYFVDKFYEYRESYGDELKQVIFDAESINTVDSSAIHALCDIYKDLKKANIDLVFTGIKGPVRDAFKRAKFDTTIGENHFFMSIQDAVDCFDSGCLFADYEKRKNYTLQTKVRKD